MSEFPAEMVTLGDGPIDLPPVKPDVAQVFACVDCSGLDRVDPTKLGPFTSDPCDCGCGWYKLLCQICGRKVGEGTSAGTIDLGAAPDTVTGERYRDLFREDIGSPHSGTDQPGVAPRPS